MPPLHFMPLHLWLDILFHVLYILSFEDKNDKFEECMNVERSNKNICCKKTEKFSSRNKQNEIFDWLIAIKKYKGEREKKNADCKRLGKEKIWMKNVLGQNEEWSPHCYANAS